MGADISFDKYAGLIAKKLAANDYQLVTGVFHRVPSGRSGRKAKLLDCYRLVGRASTAKQVELVRKRLPDGSFDVTASTLYVQSGRRVIRRWEKVKLDDDLKAWFGRFNHVTIEV